jgi:Ser/Thr protein kinase RdoA (MazF antagonist)
MEVIERSVAKAIHHCLAKNYGIEGSLRRLSGENLNFLLTTKDEEKFVIKVVDEHMPVEVVKMETELLEHAKSAGFSLNLPYIQKNYKEKNETGIKIRTNDLYRLRLIGYIQGTELDNLSDISIKLLKNTGKSLAAFDRAIEGFNHPAAHRNHRWNLAEAGQHVDKTSLVENEIHRDNVAWAFDLWKEVKPLLGSLPHQVIHGDGNPENLLAEGDRIVGLVDFGDCCYAPRICELAICLAYLMMDRDDPMEAAGAVIDGYCSLIDLTEQELGVLFALVCGRLAVTVCMASARQQEDPENPTWFTSLAPALELLAKLRAIGVSQA